MAISMRVKPALAGRPTRVDRFRKQKGVGIGYPSSAFASDDRENASLNKIA
jgi:hypothetical protein